MTARQEDGYNKILPTRIRAILDKKKMKRNELAEKSGISRQRIGYYADGTNVPDAETLAKIAEALEVSTDYLLGLTNEETRGTAVITTYADIATCLDKIIDMCARWSIQTYYVPADGVYFVEDRYQLIINLDSDRELFDYYSAIEKMQDALKNVPSETARQLLKPFKDDLKAKTLYDAPLMF